MTDQVEGIVAQIRQRVSREPEIGIVCGSGLGGLAETLESPVTIPYSEIKGFPQTTVKGHAGELVFGMLKGKFVVCMKGRFHCYEGHAPQKILVPIYVMAALGIKALVVTNAAGGINPEFNVCDVMIIKDQICFTGMAGQNPLVGKNDERFGPRFPPMNGVFNAEFQKTLQKAATDSNFSRPVRSGVYFGVSGPSYETPHEIQLMRKLGGDSVGMSTVFEVIAAAHCGLPVLGLSLITNKCLGPDDQWDAPTHSEVLAATRDAQSEVQLLVSKFVELLDLSSHSKVKAYESFRDAKTASPVTPTKLVIAAAVALAIGAILKKFA